MLISLSSLISLAAFALLRRACARVVPYIELARLLWLYHAAIFAPALRALHYRISLRPIREISRAGELISMQGRLL